MQELLSQKRFLSAIIGSVLVTAVYWLFKDNIEIAETVTQWVALLFGGHIVGTTVSDSFGKGKVQEEAKKIVKKAKLEMEKSIQEAASKIVASDNKNPWEK